MSADLKTIADHIRYAYSRLNASEVFFGHGTVSSWDESVALVLQSLDLPWDFDQALWSCNLVEDERALVLANLSARINERVPLAYLTNKAYFCGLEFFVDDRVLVPRSPIAELIQAGFQPWLQRTPERVLDLCTGSGCIGIAIALMFEECQVDLVDISPDALAVAQINIEKFGLEDRVRVVESDGFDALRKMGESYDMIVSNPPYVDAQDIAAMPAEFRKEPSIGLASGEDGLDFVRQMLAQASNFLNDDGLLITEVGNSWEALEQAFPSVGFTWLELENGGHGVFLLGKHQLLELNIKE